MNCCVYCKDIGFVYPFYGQWICTNCLEKQQMHDYCWTGEDEEDWVNYQPQYYQPKLKRMGILIEEIDCDLNDLAYQCKVKVNEPADKIYPIKLSSGRKWEIDIIELNI